MDATPVEGGAALHERGPRQAVRRVVDPAAAFALASVVVLWWYFLAIESSPDDWAFDFRQFWQGANDVVNGVSPYPSSEALAAVDGYLTPIEVRDVFRFPYPAGAAVVLAPFGLLGFQTAAAVWSALLIVSLGAALWILGVRDWRVLAVLVTSAPIITSVRLGTLTPVLVLLLAVAWRWRDRRWVAGGSLALAVSLKVFLWPLAVWLAATRRFAAAIVTTLLAAALTFGAWAAIGFDGLAGYPELVRTLADTVGGLGFSLVALGTELGLPSGVADTLPWIVGLTLLAGVVVTARGADGDRVAFSLAVVASLALTPIVWLHYIALFVVPVAVFRPRFAWPWALFWLFWLTPYQGGGDLWRILLVYGLLIALLAGAAVVGSRRAAA